MNFKMIKTSLFVLAVCSVMVTTAAENEWFGPKKQYKCHCTENKCDRDGNCLAGSKCERGWFGPSCQYNDLAAGITVKSSSKLTDGDDGTCQNINKRLLVKLHQRHIIHWIKIILNTYSGDQVLTVTAKDSKNGDITPCNHRVEYQIDNTIDIICKDLIPFDTVEIQFEGQLYLCSVYISGGRNLALKQQATQSSTFGSYGAMRAVDGNTDGYFDNGTCSHTDVNGKWIVHFEKPKTVYSIRLYNRVDSNAERLQGFEITAFDVKNNQTYKYKDAGVIKTIYNVLVETMSIPISKLQVTVNNYLILCEVEIFGDDNCSGNTYGLECLGQCNCTRDSELCNVYTGACSPNCVAGSNSDNCRKDKKWFGPKNQYKCHCTENKCDGDGNCLPGSKCERGWFGPSCQYRDLAARKQLLNVDTFTDGDDSTCRPITPKHNADLTMDQHHVITWIRVVSNISNHELYFTVMFKINEGNNFNIQCVDPVVHKINNITADIYCKNNQLVSSVRIQFMKNTNLCSVYVSGGRNIALKESASQSSDYEIYTADKAVDGNKNSSFERGQTCTHTIDKKPGWWKLHFDHPKTVYQFILYNTDKFMFRLDEFNLSTYNANNELVHKYTERKHKIIYYVSNSNISTPVSVVEVKVAGILTLCELEIYGDCEPKTFGLACNQNCSNKCQNSDCSPINGNCLNCKNGYMGADCSTDCIDKRYGAACNKICSENCTDQLCNTVDGKCKSCTAGKTGDYCDQDCALNRYGQNCSQTCSSQCKNSKCNPVNGSCLSCIAGYMGADCLTQCETKRHGQDCHETCSSLCLHQLCDHVTGDCNSCVAGKVGVKCTEDCPGRTYGLNCTNKCPDNCAMDGRCDPANGTCLHGCVAGYQGEHCSQTCIDGFYGQNCTQSCSSWCLKQLCNHVTGDCHMCVEGKAGSKCTDDQGHSAIKMKYIGTGIGIGVATSSFVFLLVVTVVYFLKRAKCIGNKTTHNDSSIEKKEKAETVNLKDVKIVESATTEQDSADVYHNEITNMYDVIGSRGFEKQHSSDYMKY